MEHFKIQPKKHTIKLNIHNTIKNHCRSIEHRMQAKKLTDDSTCMPSTYVYICSTCIQNVDNKMKM